MTWLYSRALVEEFSRATCWAGEPSAQLNVMPTAHPFWHSDKPMDFSRPFLFGLTCRVLTAGHGEGLLTWYLAGFPVKTSPAPDPEPDSTESDRGSGEKWCASFATWHRDTSTWKTHQCSLLGGLTAFSETWPTSGSMRTGECWERSTLERCTSEKGCGFWQTPVADDAVNRTVGKWNSRGEPKLSAEVMLYPTPVAIDTGTRCNRSASDGAKLRPTLGAMARFNLWPTPTASLGTNGGRITPNKARDGGTLIEAISMQMWPTPTARDWKSGQASNSTYQRNSRPLSEVVLWPTPTAITNSGGPALCKWGGSGSRQKLKNLVSPAELNGQLNPTWVEWLMGWPIGWTGLEPLAMGKFQEWRQQHGGCSLSATAVSGEND
jgi:hypothetical protein